MILKLTIRYKWTIKYEIISVYLYIGRNSIICTLFLIIIMYEIKISSHEYKCIYLPKVNRNEKHSHYRNSDFAMSRIHGGVVSLDANGVLVRRCASPGGVLRQRRGHRSRGRVTAP